MGNENKGRIKKLIDGYDKAISLSHHAEIERELRDEDDLFLLLCFSELLGIPNPVSYYTMEMYPLLIEKFHHWHLRMGMEKSPLEDIRCC